MGKMIELTASDGHKLAAYRADPSGKPRGAIVVIQEIFGVNSHIKAVTDGFAADGYVAIAPAMFDRVQRGYDTGYSPPEIEAGRAIMQKMDWTKALLDVDAAVAQAKQVGKVGIVGYCWGGTVVWRAASKTAGLAAAVPYYGGGMPNFINEKPKVPVMAHFGELDQSPTLEQAKAIAKAHPEITAHFYPGAGHAFANPNNPWKGYREAAAKDAWARTVAFFEANLKK